MIAALRIATRSSPLALWQAEFVAARLRESVPHLVIHLVRVDTHGDRTQAANIALHTIGGQGVFVKEVEMAVLDGRAEVAVHSAKDLPTQLVDGLMIAAVPEREDVRDAMVGSTIAGLPLGARVATGSIRRRAQLAAIRPDLEFHELRGNMHTRIEKAKGFDAIVVGAAGLTRLGLGGHIAEFLGAEVMLPMVGQGAIAVECRADDEELRALLHAIDNFNHHATVRAERSFLGVLGSGCELPVAALAEWSGDALRLRALVLAEDGSQVVRADVLGTEPVAVGREAAGIVLRGGAAALLDRM